MRTCKELFESCASRADGLSHSYSRRTRAAEPAKSALLEEAEGGDGASSVSIVADSEETNVG